MDSINEVRLRPLVTVDLTDDGRIDITVHGPVSSACRQLTVVQARELAGILTAHAADAQQYLAEQAAS